MSDATQGLDTANVEAAEHSNILADVLGGAGKVAMIGIAAAAVAAGAAIAGMAVYLGGAVGQAIEAEESQARLNIVLKATGGAAGVTSEMANELATSLSKVTTFSDDTIIAAESVLLRFQGISEETFPRATKATLDLAATLGIDASSAAFQLGRALEVPGEGLRVLTRAGIILTDQEKQMIETMVTAGQTADAQAFILDKLESSVGGAAEAMGQTFGGQMQILKNRLSEVQEGIGMALLPVLRDLMDQFLLPAIPVLERLGEAFGAWLSGVALPALTALIPRLVEFGQSLFNIGRLLVTGDFSGGIFGLQEDDPAIGFMFDLRDAVIELGTNIQTWVVGTAIPAVQAFIPIIVAFGQQAVQWISTVVIPALITFGAWFQENRETILQVLAGIAIGFAAFSIITTVVGWITGIIAAVSAMGAAIGAAGGIIGTIVAILGGPLTIAIGVVAGVIALFTAAWLGNWFDIRGKTQAVIDFILPYIKTGIENLKDTVAIVLREITEFWDAHGENIIAAARGALEFIQNLVSDILSYIQGLWSEHGDAILASAQASWENIHSTIQTIIGFIQSVIEVTATAIRVFWEAWGATILEVASNTWEAIQEVTQSVIDIIKGIVDLFIAAFTGDWEAFGEALRDIWDAAWDLVITVLETAWDNISAIVGNLVTQIIEFFTLTDWAAVGQSIIDGIKTGLTNAASGLATAAANAAQAAWDAVMGFIGGHSPSELFMEVGSSMAEGIIVGMESYLPQIEQAAWDIANAMYEPFTMPWTAEVIASAFPPEGWQALQQEMSMAFPPEGIPGMVEELPAPAVPAGPIDWAQFLQMIYGGPGIGMPGTGYVTPLELPPAWPPPGTAEAAPGTVPGGTAMDGGAPGGTGMVTIENVHLYNQIDLAMLQASLAELLHGAG